MTIGNVVDYENDEREERSNCYSLNKAGRKKSEISNELLSEAARQKPTAKSKVVNGRRLRSEQKTY